MFMLLLKFPMIISMLVVRLEFITLGSHPLLILYQIISRDSKIDNLFRLILQVTPTTGQCLLVVRYEVLSYMFTTRTVSS